jgi:hypothetical protein
MSPFYDKGRKCPTRDIAKAKKLLADAGLAIEPLSLDQVRRLAQEIDDPTQWDVSIARDLAVVSARMDPPATSSRLAIVAPADFVYGLARMYATYRELQEQGRKQVEVFRAMADAMAWLEGAAAD